MVASLNQTSDKHVQNYLRGLAEEVNGKYTDYSDDTVIVTIPLSDGRYQNVTGHITPRGDGIMLEFMSKVCKLEDYPDISLVELLELNSGLCYSKILLRDEFIEVGSSTKYELCTYDQVRYMIFEVARVADELEHRFTGEDVY